jgi:hypothetical protein
MKSILHCELQTKALHYLRDKGYWIKAIEMPTPVGIIDAWGISNSNNYETAAIEVKVSRNDYHSRSQKYKEFNPHNIANYCYLLCPEGMIKETESPNWGILWFSEKTKRLRLIRKATRFDMTDKAKLDVMIHFFYSGLNNVEKLTENFNL